MARSASTRKARRTTTPVQETPQDEATIQATNATPDADLPTDDQVAEETKTKKTKKPKWAPMDEARLAWVQENARPAVSACLCGCGGDTKGRFVPGHDATLKAQLENTPGAELVLAKFGW